MRVPTLLIFLLAVWPHPAPAGSPIIPTISEEQLRQFARARGTDAYQLLLGPTAPPAAAVAAADCHALHARRVALTRRQLDYGRDFWDEPRHSAAVFIGTIWTPAFYYLPFRAVAATSRAGREAAVGAELDALRARSAGMRCFEN